MTTLTTFLLDRIAEDEEAARVAAGDPTWTFEAHPLRTWRGQVVSDDGAIADIVDHWDGRHIARHDPARVLAECEAKRRIVAEVFPITPDYDPLYVQRVLAQVYVDHPDYDPAWALT